MKRIFVILSLLVLSAAALQAQEVETAPVDSTLLGKSILSVIGSGVKITQSVAVQQAMDTYVRENANKPIAHFVTGSIELAPRCEQVYELPCTVTLADGASLLDVLVIASKQSLSGLKADIDVQGALKKNGVLRAPLKFRDLDLSQFTRK